MTLLQCAFVLFAAGATGGISLTIMLALRLRYPPWFGTAHGLLGLAALATLFAANLRGLDTTPALAWWALGVLLAALLGGLTLFRFLFRGGVPLLLAVLHGSLAVVGIYLLYCAAFGG